MRINLTNSNCARCHGTGKLFAREKEEQNGTHYSVVFRCDCPIGLQLPFRWPMWNPIWLARYSVDFETFSDKQLEL